MAPASVTSNDTISVTTGTNVLTLTGSSDDLMSGISTKLTLTASNATLSVWDDGFRHRHRQQ
jgi:hypothetical protein